MQFFAQAIVVILWIACIHPGHINDIDQEVRALHMPQKVVSESDALMCAFDKPGNVGNSQARVVFKNNGSKDGVQRCEGVRCNLGVRIADAREQG